MARGKHYVRGGLSYTRSHSIDATPTTSASYDPLNNSHFPSSTSRGINHTPNPTATHVETSPTTIGTTPAEAAPTPVDATSTTLAPQPFVTTSFPRVLKRVPLPKRDELLSSDGRIIIRLNRAKKGFLGSTEPTRFFRKEIKKVGFEYWPKFKMVKNEVKEAWWDTFKARFYWGPHKDNKGNEWPGYSDDVVREAWNSVASARYSDAISDAKKDWLKGTKPTWMGEEVFAEHIARWESFECKEISRKNKENRLKGKFGLTMQTVGSIPIEEHLERLVDAAPPGVVVDDADVFQYTHKKTLPPNTEPTLETGWVDEKSKETFNEYTSKVALTELESDPMGEVEATTQPDQASKFFGSLWRDAVKKVGGNTGRKDRLYGFGNSISVVTSNVSSSSSSSKNCNCTASQLLANATPEEAIQILQLPAWQDAFRVVFSSMQNENQASPQTPHSTGDSIHIP